MEESPFWGRITVLGPDKLDLLSQFEFRRGKMLALSFELDGDALEDIRGTVTAALRDACGYFNYTLKLSDENQRKAILEKLFCLTAKTMR